MKSWFLRVWTFGAAGLVAGALACTGGGSGCESGSSSAPASSPQTAQGMTCGKTTHPVETRREKDPATEQIVIHQECVPN